MKITNRYNYPDTVVNAITESMQRPDANTVRVTAMIDPPAIRHYLITKWDDIEFDVDEGILPLFGTAWHKYLSGYTPDRSISEERLFMCVPNAGGPDWIVTGQPDMRSFDGVLDDYKVTSAWTYVFGRASWEQQLNLYALLCTANGYTVLQCYINAFLRDWTALNASRYGPKYPQRQFYRTKINLWTEETQTQFLKDRLRDHTNGPRPCTPEERWKTEDAFAVYKGKNKTASRVLPTRTEAEAWINKQTKPKLYAIQERIGSCRRCDDYCVVRNVCEFRK